jgi:hypothetical protein
MKTYTLTTTTGQRIEVSCWESNALNFQIHINGEYYTEGSSFIGAGDTEETEAQHQAQQTANEIEAGRIRRLDDQWRYIDDQEIERAKEEWLVCAEVGHPLNHRCFFDLGEAKLAIEKAFPGDENDWDEQAMPGSPRNMWQWYKRGGEDLAVIAEILPQEGL